MSKQSTTHNIKLTIPAPKKPSGRGKTPSFKKAANGNSQKMKQNKNQKKKNQREKNLDFLSMAPIAQSRQITTGSPSYNGMKAFNIKHRELIGTLTVPANSLSFQTLLRLRLNPGSKGTFNWLSTIAPNFEFYRFRKLKFIYETRSSTTQTGSLLMSPDYDAADGSFAQTEQSIFSNIGSTDDAVWKGRVLQCRPELLNRLYNAHVCMADPRFVQTNQDLKTVDAGQMFICTDVQTTGVPTVLGKLIVEYDVDFFAPQQPTEPQNQGGALVVVSGSNLSPVSGSAQPILMANPLSQSVTFQENNPILDQNFFLNGTQLTQTFPSGTIGRFTQDYSGLASFLSNATTGMTGGNFQNLWVGPMANLNQITGAAGDNLVPLASGADSISNVGGTQAQSINFINAKLGDLLKVSNPTATGLITNAVLRLGGVSPAALNTLVNPI